jgi:hypothetical protein
MKKIGLNILILLLASCTTKQISNQPAAIRLLPDYKLKQKAVVLQQKLSKAEHALCEDQEAIRRLRSQVCDAELKAIESQINNLEQKWISDPRRVAQGLRPEVSHLFLEERETLSRIIQTGPDSVRAQVLLDRILQLITQLSDSVNISG